MSEPVEFNTITDGTTCGDGTFDKLMQSIKSHLKEEYDSSRIRGSEYSQVYLGSLQSAMSQAIQWELGAQIAANQALLLEQQILIAERQKSLLDEQIQQIIAQTALTNQQTANLTLEAVNIPKQGEILDLQSEQLNYGNLQIVERTRADKYNVEDMLPAQKAILDQKKFTEEAQIKDSVNGAAVVGTIGARNKLLEAQKEGFDRDAEQKATRTLVDTWGMAIGSGIGGEEYPDAIGKAQISNILEQLRNKADLSYTP